MAALGGVGVATFRAFCGRGLRKRFFPESRSNPGVRRAALCREAPAVGCWRSNKSAFSVGTEPAYRSDLEPMRPRDLDVTRAT